MLTVVREQAGVDTSRDAELGALLKEWDEAKALNVPRVVFVRGPKGIGKSHLMGALRQRALARGALVLEGASQRDGRRAWGLVAGLVGQALQACEAQGVSAAVLTNLNRQLGSMRGAGSGAIERSKVFAAAAELLGLVGRSAPIVILPDVDVADPASLELVRYLVAALLSPESRTSGLWVLTFRDDASLPAPLADLVARASARTLALRGFDVEGLRAYLQRGDVVQRLLDATAGNPEALGSMLERSREPVELSGRRLERMESSLRNLVEVLQLSAEPLSLPVIAQTLELEPSECAARLDELLRARLVSMRFVDGQAQWRLTDLVPTAAPSSTNTLLATRLASALEQAGHLEGAARLLLVAKPSAAPAVALRAARALFERGALEEAAELLRAIEAPASFELAAKVDAALGRHGSAARRFLAAARHATKGEQARLLADAAAALIKRGKLVLAEGVLARLDTPAAWVRRAEVMLLRGQAADALAACAVLADGLPTASVLDLENLRGKALLVLGRVEEAELVFERNAVRAHEAGDLNLVSTSRLNQGVAAFKRGDREKAATLWSATGDGYRPATAHAEANLGSAFAETGDFALAVDHLGRALHVMSRCGAPREVALIASNLARAQHMLGDLPRAWELSVHAYEQASRVPDPYVEGSARLNQGAIRLDEREYAEAARWLEEARVRFERVGHDGYAALAAVLKARAHVGLGERAQAEVELSRRVVERGAGSNEAALELEFVRAELCLAGGDLLGAGRSVGRIREALLSRTDLEGPYRVAFLSGRVKAAGNDVAGAQAEYQRAGRLLEELVQRAPPALRTGFLAIPRRAEVVAAVEPELRLPRALASLQPKAPLDMVFGLVGRSKELARITKQLEPIGRSNATALIRGESGTGKELLAEALHALSPRRHMPLVKVNCAAMVEELLLSELFGHEKGAFTGAIKERKGRFEMADGGTIFLDEIGDISPKAQVALLRVLQEREFERVGGSKTIKVDVRVLCATNRDLERLIAQGAFRADLYYRLKGVMIELPPLRARLDDIESLSQHFLQRVAKERGEPVRRLSASAIALLQRHAWPGNVRELENVIASAAIFAEGTVIDVEAFLHVEELRLLAQEGQLLPAPIVEDVKPTRVEPVMPASLQFDPAAPIDFYEVARQRGISLKDLRHEMEMQCIKRALVDADGNISEAARLLKMKRSRLSQIVNAEPVLREVAHGE